MSFSRLAMFVVCLLSFFSMDIALSATLKDGKASFFASSNAFEMPSNEVSISGEPKLEAEKLSGYFKVDLGKFESNNELRDEHMRKEDVLNVKGVTLAEFWLDPTDIKGSSFTGQLKFRGIKKPVKGKLEVFGGKSYKFTFDISCKDYGIDPPSMKIVYMHDKVTITATGDIE